MIRTIAGIAAVLLLSGCGGPEEAPQPRPAAAQASVHPTRPVGPVLQYDGRYLGPIAGAGGGYTCRERIGGTRELVIRRGRASIMMAERGSPLQGTVLEDGTLRAVDLIDRSSAVTGQVINDQFVGTWRNGVCPYSLNLRRVG